VGDIVYLKKNETAPADLLILDSYDSKVQVNISNIEGKLDEVSRFSCPLTRSKNINTTLVQKNSRSRPSGFDYKKILTGFVKYSGSESEKMQKCCGYIKLKKDPKGDYFNDSNIIFREE
jgi:magnesium-transporting ATPase (P-type)